MFYVYTSLQGTRDAVKIRLEDIPEYGLDIELPDSSLGPVDTGAYFNPGEDISVNPDISGKLIMTRDNDEIILSGVVNSTARLRCSRCLAQYETGLQTDVSLVLKVTSPASLDDEAELDENEIPIHGSEIDLGAILLQEIILDVPMKPLCDINCPGLCPQCGHPKGSPQCRCGTGDGVDPRWMELMKIRDRIS
jgi:uncharacterized protein